MIARFWDINSGRVLIGGQDVKAYTLSELMSNISMVFQNVYLFADTIENNIKFGKPDATLWMLRVSWKMGKWRSWNRLILTS